MLPRLFEDREGDVWVATLGGLDRFRNYAVTTYAQHEGFGTIPGWGSVVTGRDGSIWMGTNDGLRMWNHGEVTIYGRSDNHESESRTVWSPVRYVASGGLRDHVFVSVFADNAGRILVSTPYAFGYMENGRFVSDERRSGRNACLPLPRTDKGISGSRTKTKVCCGYQRTELFSEISWASIGHKDGAQSLAADRSTGGLWLGFDGGGVAYFSDGQIKETYGRRGRARQRQGQRAAHRDR